MFKINSFVFQIILFIVMLSIYCFAVNQQTLAMVGNQLSGSIKFGYIDKSGKFVIQPKFTNALEFRNGLAVVVLDKKYGIINTSGKFVVQPTYDSYSSLRKTATFKKMDHRQRNEDITVDSTADPNFNGWIKNFHYRNDYELLKKGYTITDKQAAIENKQMQYRQFVDGLSKVNFRKKVSSIYDFKNGYFDTKGNLAIKPIFHNAEDFSNGLAAVSIEATDGKYLKNVYIDKKGNIVIDKGFNYIRSFKDGVAIVAVLNDSGVVVLCGDADNYFFGLIDKQGNYIIDPKKEKYTKFEDFSEGLAKVKKDGKFGFVDKKGNLVIDCKFITAGTFNNGLAPAGVQVK